MICAASALIGWCFSTKFCIVSHILLISIILFGVRIPFSTTTLWHGFLLLGDNLSQKRERGSRRRRKEEGRRKETGGEEGRGGEKRTEEQKEGEERDLYTLCGFLPFWSFETLTPSLDFLKCSNIFSNYYSILPELVSYFMFLSTK